MKPDNENLADRLAELERRLAEVEKRMGLPAPAAAGPVNTSRLAELRQLGGKDGGELLDAVIGLFLSSTTPLLGSLREATLKGDGPGLRSAAHALKGTSSNLGAHEMMALCVKLEKIAEIGAFGEAARVLDELDGEYQRVHAALEAMRSPEPRPAVPPPIPSLSPRKPEAVSPAPAPIPAPRPGPRKAVICDDDKTLLHIVRHILEKQSFIVFDAVNGEEGLGLIRTVRPSLILLDLDMPVKDGMSVLRALKDGGDKIGHLIVLTHHETASVHREVRELGASDSMTKPFDPAGFTRSIETLVREGKI